MTPLLVEAKADLFSVLDSGPLNGVDSVYDYEPHREASGPCYVTVELFAITPTDTTWAVRVYNQLLDSPEGAAATRDVAVVAVDDRLGQNNYGPSRWEAGFDDALGCLVARTLVDVGRETF
ncbi:MAG: hypothetical protein WKF86_00140 [Acidimicrobiales bacterium]